MGVTQQELSDHVAKVLFVLIGGDEKGRILKRRSVLCWESGGSQGVLTKAPFRSRWASFAFRHSSLPDFGNFGLLSISCCHRIVTGFSLLSAQAVISLLL